MGTTPNNLDEAKRCRRMGIISVVLGVLSGPMALTAGILAGANTLPEKTKEALGIALLAAVVVIVLAIQIGLFRHIRRRTSPPDGTRLAVWGLFTTCTCVVLVFLWVRAILIYGT